MCIRDRVNKQEVNKIASEEPAYDPTELYGVVPADLKTTYDAREIIARITDTPFIAAISGFGPVFNNTGAFHKFRFKLVMKIYKFIFKKKSALIICQSNHDKNFLIENKICEEASIYIISGFLKILAGNL